jgi:hypothetical protein
MATGLSIGKLAEAAGVNSRLFAITGDAACWMSRQSRSAVIPTQASGKREVFAPTVPAVSRRIFPLPEIVRRLFGKPVPTIG